MTNIPTRQNNSTRPSDYDWKAPVSESSPGSSAHSKDYDWAGKITPHKTSPEEMESILKAVKQLKEHPTTTLNFSTGPNGVAISDNHGNEFIQRPNSTPAITCDGKAQGVNVANGIEALGKALEQLPPEALAGALSNAAKAGPLPSVSGNVTFEGGSPLTALCNAGKDAGILQR